MNDLTLDDGRLGEPMVEDDSPTISMAAIGENPPILPWQTQLSYRLSLALTPDGLARASAVVGKYEYHPDAVPGFPWRAHCAIIASRDLDISGQDFREWCRTDEAARSAVEEFIAAWIDVHLSEDQ